MEGLVAGLVGILIGASFTWGLNQVTAYLKDRDERRKPIGRALADLLELRLQAVALRRFMQLCAAELRLPRDAEAVMERTAFAVLGPGPGSLLGDTEDLTKRYNAAIDLVAEADPVLAFRMRSKDKVPWFLSMVRNMAQLDPITAHAMPDLSEEIASELEDTLDEFILELARLHSWRAARQVRRRLKEPVEIPPELRGALHRYFAALMQAATPQATTVPRLSDDEPTAPAASEAQRNEEVD